MATGQAARTVTRWTCWRCFRPIGEVRGQTITIKRRGAEIVAQLPCTQTCPHCRTLCIMPLPDQEDRLST